MPTIDQRGALGVLAKPRVLEIAAALGLGLPGRLLKSELVDAIAATKRAPFPRILDLLRRNELKATCQAAGIDDSGRAKAVIADRILGRQPVIARPASLVIPQPGRRLRCRTSGSAISSRVGHCARS